MRFNGWVKLDRSLAEDVCTGRLTGREALVLMILILWADKATGGGTINAPTLLYRLGNDRTFMCSKTAERILNSLHEKRRIWYRPSRAFEAQPYWVNGYQITIGRKKGSVSMLNLSQLFDKETISQADVWGCVEASSQGSSEGSSQGSSDKNKTLRPEDLETERPKSKTKDLDSTHCTQSVDSTKCDTLKDSPIGVKADPLVVINESVVTNRKSAAPLTVTGDRLLDRIAQLEHTMTARRLTDAEGDELNACYSKRRLCDAAQKRMN